MARTVIKTPKKRRKFLYLELAGVAMLAGALYAAYSWYDEFVAHPVKCNPNKLSSETFFVGTPYEFTTVFNPVSHAYNLFNCMSGVTTGAPCEGPWEVLAYQMSVDDIRCLHNAWLKHIDGKTSLYTWIVSENANSPREVKAKDGALWALTRSGVGPRTSMFNPTKKGFLRI